MKFVPAEWRTRASEIFGIDLRTLALFRVSLASVLIFYALRRLPDASAFFTDWGLLPRAYLVQADGWARLSLYLVNGDLWFAVLLLLVTFVCAIALWLGYRTRAMTVALFILFTSLINRNPVILIGGDSLLACLLFWGMFLPLGARWSIDAALSTTPPPQANLHCSPASAGLLLQVMSVYFFSAWLKNGPDWWPDGTAVYYTMELERYASWLGRNVLASWPGPMHWLSYYVYFLEWLGPVLAFSPWLHRPLRFAVMACLMAMHLGFVVFMEIEYFPFVSLTSLTTLLGGWFWERQARVDEQRHPNGPRIFYDRDCGFCLNSCRLLQHFLVLPRATIAPAQDFQRARALLEANYSWVVIDVEDRAHIKWRAFVALLKPSPLFGWLWRLARADWLERPGNAAYDFVGRHRGRIGRLTAGLMRARDVRFEVGRGAQRFAALFVVLVLAWNLATVKAVPKAYLVVTSPLFRVVRLDQIWNMFAPYPSHLDGWTVFPGKLEDGTDVDVLRPGAALSWERPPLLSAVHENIAWHTYRWRLLDMPGHYLYYGKYLCRQWNWRAPKGKRLLNFQMDYVQEISKPAGQPQSLERRTAWYHDCRPGQVEEEKQQQRERREDPMELDRKRPV